MENNENDRRKHGVITRHNDGGIEVYIPKIPIDIHQSAPDTTALDRSNWTKEQIEERDAENLSRSVRRARKNIRHHVRNNKHTHFVTFTYDLKKYPDNKSRYQRMHTVLREMRRKYGQFHYVVVPEFHDEDKESAGLIHWHGVMDLTNIDLVRALDSNTGELLTDKKGNKLYNMPYWDSTGYSSVSKIKDNKKVASYIMKYITKDIDEVVGKGQRKYWSSHGDKPVQQYLTFAEVSKILVNHKPNYTDERGAYFDI